MKSPGDLAERLERQWRSADTREARLLNPREHWPLELTISKPSARQVSEEPSRVRSHITAWRVVSVGKVHWETVRYRDLAEPISVPTRWELPTPSSWAQAAGDPVFQSQFAALSTVTAAVDPCFHQYFVRNRNWLRKPISEVIAAAKLAVELQPECLGGQPLRMLGGQDIDSKFSERNRGLLTALLDIRHSGLASELGLAAFLGAADESDHWLLVADLDGNLLPFKQMRLRDKDLMKHALPGERVVVVENERCLYLLPELPKTIAILGAGLNLEWLGAPTFLNKALAYWGDIDTWGLRMLASAKRQQPHLTSVLMDEPTFAANQQRAVVEPRPVDGMPENELTKSEAQLWRYLLTASAGRLEQEFLPLDSVRDAVHGWVARCSPPHKTTERA